MDLFDRFVQFSLLSVALRDAFFSLTFYSFLFLSKCWCTRSVVCLVFADTESPHKATIIVATAVNFTVTWNLYKIQSDIVWEPQNRRRLFRCRMKWERPRKGEAESEKTQPHMFYLFNLLFYYSRFSSQFLFCFSIRSVHFESGVWFWIVAAAHHQQWVVPLRVMSLHEAMRITKGSKLEKIKQNWVYKKKGSHVINWSILSCPVCIIKMKKKRRIEEKARRRWVHKVIKCARTWSSHFV